MARSRGKRASELPRAIRGMSTGNTITLFDGVVNVIPAGSSAGICLLRIGWKFYDFNVSHYYINKTNVLWLSARRSPSNQRCVVTEDIWTNVNYNYVFHLRYKQNECPLVEREMLYLCLHPANGVSSPKISGRTSITIISSPLPCLPARIGCGSRSGLVSFRHGEEVSLVKI